MGQQRIFKIRIGDIERTTHIKPCSGRYICPVGSRVIRIIYRNTREVVIPCRVKTYKVGVVAIGHRKNQQLIVCYVYSCQGGILTQSQHLDCITRQIKGSGILKSFYAECCGDTQSTEIQCPGVGLSLALANLSIVVGVNIGSVSQQCFLEIGVRNPYYWVGTVVIKTHPGIHIKGNSIHCRIIYLDAGKCWIVECIEVNN